MMKRALPLVLIALLLACLAAMPAMADEAGVLTETEMGEWLNRLLLSTVGVSPLNAPVGEESLTEDGYAFLYENATLYYDQPTLTAQSALRAVAVTGEALDMPRGIRLGAPVEMLMAAYAWQNPTLTGDDTFAPLYVLDQLPQAAYWAYAQRAGDTLQSVQCAIHARMGEGRYTDTGILYTVQNGAVESIRVYGISGGISLADVQGNLAAVGEKPTTGDSAVGALIARSDTLPFAQSDLQFSRMDFLRLTENGAARLFGSPKSDAYAQEQSGGYLHTLTYPGVSLVFSLDAQKQNPTLESLTINAANLAGPRGLTVGMALDAAIKLFQADGGTNVVDGALILYGDGRTPPFGTLEREGGTATVRYALPASAATGDKSIALHLTFADQKLTELMLYRN